MTMLRRLDDILERIENLLVIVMFSVAFLLGVLQVFLRYVFAIGFHWNEAVFVTLTVSAVLIGGSRAVRNGYHARVELIATIMPERVVFGCNLVALVSALLLSAFYSYCGYLYVIFVNSMGITDMDSGIPDAITYSIVPLTMGLFVIRYFIKIVEWRHDPGAYSRMGGGELPDTSSTPGSD
jgi:TRAP-type C4-dicarboxylate transport system permease small subunit